MILICILAGSMFLSKRYFFHYNFTIVVYVNTISTKIFEKKNSIRLDTAKNFQTEANLHMC